MGRYNHTRVSEEHISCAVRKQQIGDGKRYREMVIEVLKNTPQVLPFGDRSTSKDLDIERRIGTALCVSLSPRSVAHEMKPCLQYYGLSRRIKKH